MMMGDRRYIVCTFWIGFFVDVYFFVARKSALDFLRGNKKRGVYLYMRKGTFLVLMVSLFLLSSDSKIYTVYIPNINHPVE